MSSINSIKLPDNTIYDINAKTLNGRNIIELTEAEYNALSYADKHNGSLYFLTDANKKPTKIFGFHINGGESNPSSMVTYLEDAIGYTPAYMDYTNDVFNYGSWQDAFFLPRPCILGMNGTVIKYLNPNDYSKDVDGNTVTIDSGLTNANVMIEFPKIWYKIVPDGNSNNSGSVYISNIKVDSDYHDWAYIDYQGVHKEHFYMPAYNGSLVSNKLRSISNAQVMKSKTTAEEITYVQANGNGWYTEDFGEIQLINFLLILMGKSVNTQAVFGQGINSGGNETFNDGFRTGVHNTKGLFYGTNSGSASYSNAVKVFGIENWWGFQWRRYAGHMLVNGAQKIKLCYGREDGTTTDNYNTNGTGYVTKGATPSGTSDSYISKMTFNGGVMLSSVSSGTATTYYCDGQWFNNSATCYALRGGYSRYGTLVGAFCVYLSATPGYSYWAIGAAASYK